MGADRTGLRRRFAAPTLAHAEGEVVADGPRREGSPAGDLLDARAVGGEFQHVSLPSGQRTVAGADRLRGQLRVDVPATGVTVRTTAASVSAETVPGRNPRTPACLFRCGELGPGGLDPAQDPPRATLFSLGRGLAQ